MDFRNARKRMVENQIRARGITDPRVLKAFLKVKRHKYMPESLHSKAYNDHPLPIGEKQTISQPYMVAIMTEALRLQETDIVLEIGTGSGYQTAILAELAQKVYSIERIPSLAQRSREVLDEMGYINILLRCGDGTCGWAEHAPYNAIIVTAGAPKVPSTLKDQLGDGGRLVIPIGDEFSQVLIRVTREDVKFKEEDLGGCRFVKLIGRYSWKE